MKKNITINLYGELYNIDEDAYEALDKYLKSIARYFSREAEGKEVASDIEHRVAELLWERKQQGHTTVDIEAVRQIIHQIGAPEQMGGESNERKSMFDSAKETAQKVEPTVIEWCKNAFSYVNSRRFYRSASDSMIAGVCGGLTYYFGINDPIWWRLAFVLLTVFTHGFFLIVYLVLWMLTPMAITPEDKLNMKGEDVNPQTLGEQVLNDTQNRSTPQPVPSKSCTGGCATIMGGCLLSLIAFPCLVVVAAIFLKILFEVIGFGNFHGCFFNFNEFPVWGMFLCALTVLGIPIYALLRKMWPSASPMSGTQITFLVLIWLIAAIYFIYAIYSIANGCWDNLLFWEHRVINF